MFDFFVKKNTVTVKLKIHKSTEKDRDEAISKLFLSLKNGSFITDNISVDEIYASGNDIDMLRNIETEKLLDDVIESVNKMKKNLGSSLHKNNEEEIALYLEKLVESKKLNISDADLYVLKKHIKEYYNNVICQPDDFNYCNNNEETTLSEYIEEVKKENKKFNIDESTIDRRIDYFADAWKNNISAYVAIEHLRFEHTM